MPKIVLPEVTEISGQTIEGKVKLTWKYTDGKAEGFKIFKSTCEGCPLLEVCEIKIKKYKNIISWIDTDVHLGYNYWYQVVSFYKGKIGPKSEIIRTKCMMQDTRYKIHDIKNDILFHRVKISFDIWILTFGL